jgi:hypothetical protein
VLNEMPRLLELCFAKTLDDGLLHGNGTAHPQGVIGIAAAASGATVW